MIRVCEFYACVIGSLRGELVLVAAVLFFAGLLSAPWVVHGKIRVLLWYPLWIWRHIQSWIEPRDSFLAMVLVILCLNATSLLVNVLSGLLGVLPFVFSCLVGLHVGVIVVEETGRLHPLGMLLNPVACLELPATWISLSLGIELGLFQLDAFSLGKALPLLGRGLFVYAVLIFPLLVIAAFLEVLLIKWGVKLAAVREHGQGLIETGEKNHKEGAN